MTPSAAGPVLELWPAGTPVVVRADGVVLREWEKSDVGALVALYDTVEMDRRTPVASPFDEAAALHYVAAAHRARRESGALQLAITVPDDPLGVQAVGELLTFAATDDPGTVELAYGVRADRAGRGLVSRSVRALLGLAASTGLTRARLLIASDNEPSQRLAAATGFARTADPVVERRRKGYALPLDTWERVL